MTNTITYEYPLNEKTRSYLRFEFLFLQIKKCKDFTHESDPTLFFKALFELLDLSERCDIRHELVKDLRLLAEQMRLWLEHDEVDRVAVSELLADVEQLAGELLAMPKQLSYFKTNRFLTSLKQRFSIPSGCCNFDLPQYHYWLSEGQAKQRKDARVWIEHFSALKQALLLFLKIKRSQGILSAQSAVNGFYQGEVENCDFVTLILDTAFAVYPMISGHKNRYSIRFICSDIENNLSEQIEFKQICC